MLRLIILLMQKSRKKRKDQNSGPSCNTSEAKEHQETSETRKRAAPLQSGLVADICSCQARRGRSRAVLCIDTCRTVENFNGIIYKRKDSGACLHGALEEAGGAWQAGAHELGQETLGVRPPIPAAAQPHLRPHKQSSHIPDQGSGTNDPHIPD